MSEQLKRLKELFGDLQTSHSNLQMDRFIIHKAGRGTTYGAYRQALRELHKRYRGLKSNGLELRRVDVDIAETEHLLLPQKTTGKFDRQRLEIELLEHRLGREDLLHARSEGEREFKRFFRIADGLQKILGELTEEKRDELEADFWVKSLSVQAGFEMRSGGRVSAGVLDTVASLPEEEREKVKNLILNEGNGAYDNSEVPEFDVAGEVDVRALLE